MKPSPPSPWHSKLWRNQTIALTELYGTELHAFPELLDLTIRLSTEHNHNRVFTFICCFPELFPHSSWDRATTKLAANKFVKLLLIKF